MAKSRNQTLYSSDLNHLHALQEDFTFIGRRTRIDEKEGRLTVFALPATWKRKEKKENRRRRRTDEVDYDLI